MMADLNCQDSSGGSFHWRLCRCSTCCTFKVVLINETVSTRAIYPRYPQSHVYNFTSKRPKRETRRSHTGSHWTSGTAVSLACSWTKVCNWKPSTKCELMMNHWWREVSGHRTTERLGRNRNRDETIRNKREILGKRIATEFNHLQENGQFF